MPNTNNPKSFRFSRFEGGTGAAPVRRIKLATNTAIALGDPITVASGYGTRAATTQTVFGFAAHAVAAKAGAYEDLDVIPAVDGATFTGQAGGTLNITQAHIGSGARFAGNSGVMTLNLATVTGAPVKIVGLGQSIGNGFGTYAVLEFVVTKSGYTGQA